MTSPSFAPLHGRRAYGAGPAAILPLPAPRTGTWRPVFDHHGVARSAATGIKLSSGGTLATILRQKYDILRISPMTKLAIVEYTDRRLRTKATPVAVFDQALERLVGDLLET